MKKTDLGVKHMAWHRCTSCAVPGTGHHEMYPLNQ